VLYPMLSAIEEEIEAAKSAAQDAGVEGANTHFNQLRIQLIARARGIDGEHDYEEPDSSPPAAWPVVLIFGTAVVIAILSIVYNLAKVSPA
jgi:hypothetical protein